MGFFLLKYRNREYSREKTSPVLVPVTAVFPNFFPVFLFFLQKWGTVSLRGIQYRSVRDFPVPAFIPNDDVLYKPLDQLLSTIQFSTYFSVPCNKS
jgi:hypothetical protein